MQNISKNIDIIASRTMDGMNVGTVWAADMKGKDNRGSGSGDIDLV